LQRVIKDADQVVILVHGVRIDLCVLHIVPS
jgi:hypothetical protein